MLHLYKPKGSFRKSECKGIQNFLYHQMFSRKTLKKNVFYHVRDRLSVPINTHTPY